VRTMLNVVTALLLTLAVGVAAPSYAESKPPAVTSLAVNINTADAQTLAAALDGVGEARAQAIVAYREEHGPFRSVDDLARVKGVGERVLAANRSRITVK
jgi:competence protein ComEA